ncbi:MAG TPA: hypothetical protein VM366_03540 [Anaerolineae bacterium]|nr:hypothetical protein [Anaerolineae bacterium]
MATKPSKDAMEWAQQTTRGWAVSRAMVRELTLAMQEYADEAVAAERERLMADPDELQAMLTEARCIRARAEPEAREQLTTAATAAKGEDNK